MGTCRHRIGGVSWWSFWHRAVAVSAVLTALVLPACHSARGGDEEAARFQKALDNLFRRSQTKCQGFVTAEVNLLHTSEYEKKRFKEWWVSKANFGTVYTFKVRGGVRLDKVRYELVRDERGGLHAIVHFPQPTICGKKIVHMRSVWPRSGAEDTYEAPYLKRVSFAEIDKRVRDRVRQALLARTRLAIRRWVTEQAVLLKKDIQVRFDAEFLPSRSSHLESRASGTKEMRGVHGESARRARTGNGNRFPPAD